MNISTNIFSGTQYFIFFTSLQTFNATTISIVTGDTGVSNATIIKFGLYSIDNSNNANLVAYTDNNTSLLSSPYTLYSSIFSTNANYIVQNGSRYAISFLIIANIMPTIYGIQNIGFLTNLSPKINGISDNSQNDLIAMIEDINIVANNNIQWIKLS